MDKMKNIGFAIWYIIFVPLAILVAIEWINIMKNWIVNG
jgi:hypothetical protein